MKRTSVGKQQVNEYLQYLQQQEAQAARQNALHNALIVQTMLARDIRNRQNTPQVKPKPKSQSKEKSVKETVKEKKSVKEEKSKETEKRAAKVKQEQTEAATDLVADLIPSAGVGSALYKASQSNDTATTASYIASAVLAGAPIAMAYYNSGIRAAAAAAMGINLPNVFDVNNINPADMNNIIGQGYDNAQGGNAIL